MISNLKTWETYFHQHTSKMFESHLLQWNNVCFLCFLKKRHRCCLNCFRFGVCLFFNSNVSHLNCFCKLFLIWLFQMSCGVSLTETMVWLKGVCVREVTRPLFLSKRRCCWFEFFQMYFWIISLKWLAFSSIALDYHIYIRPSNFYSYFILSHINIFENIFWSIIYNYPKKITVQNLGTYIDDTVKVYVKYTNYFKPSTG